MEIRITQRTLFRIPGFRFIKDHSPKFIKRSVRNLIYDKKTDKPAGIFRFVSQWKKKKYSSISSQSNRDLIRKSLMKDMKLLKASNYFDTSGWKF
jgi:3-methyladenine DNA glycosylase AlkC